MRIALTSIFVDDPIAAHSFYTGILGFRSREYSAENQLAVVVSPDDPNGTALLLEPRVDSFAKEYQEQVYQMGLPIIVFDTADLGAEITRLKNKGVVFRDDLARPAWEIQNLFEDTLGNLIMLLEVSKK